MPTSAETLASSAIFTPALPATNFTAGAGMIAEVLEDVGAGDEDQGGAAARLARLARAAGTEDEAIAAVREALEALLR